MMTNRELLNWLALLSLVVMGCSEPSSPTIFTATMNDESWNGNTRMYVVNRNDSGTYGFVFTAPVDRGDVIEDELHCLNIPLSVGRTYLKALPVGVLNDPAPTAESYTLYSDGDVYGPIFQLLAADSLSNFVDIERLEEGGLSGKFSVNLSLRHPEVFPEYSTLDTMRIRCDHFYIEI